VSNLPNKSSQEIQEEKYLLFSGDNLAAGTQLQFKLDHLPMAQAAGDQGMQGSLPVIAGSGIIVAVLIASVVVMLLRRRRGSKQAVGPDVSADTAGEEPDGSSPRSARDLSAAEMEAEEEILDAEKRELVAAIARLDDDFEAQKISAEEYGRLRAEKKRRLVQVVDRQKSLAAARGDQ